MINCKIKIKGHSGCQVKVFEDNGAFFIAKRTEDMKYIPRLKEQHSKHHRFKSTFDTIKTPEVSGFLETPSTYSYFMTYIQGEDAIAFLEHATIKEISTFTDNLINFLTDSLKKSEIKAFPVVACHKKLLDIATKIDRQSIFEAVYKALNLRLHQLSKTGLPMGLCHGDLTFSNMIISHNSEITVFDFLDSFVESPLIDIAKIFQDTRHHWILHKHHAKDPIRIQSCFSMINKELSRFLDRYSINKDQLAFFEGLSLLRIVPYTKKKATLDYLANQLNQVIPL